jgi:hypothetical protein
MAKVVLFPSPMQFFMFGLELPENRKPCAPFHRVQFKLEAKAESRAESVFISQVCMSFLFT